MAVGCTDAPSLSLGGGRSLNGLLTLNAAPLVKFQTILGQRAAQFAASANARMPEERDSPVKKQLQHSLSFHFLSALVRQRHKCWHMSGIACPDSLRRTLSGASKSGEAREHATLAQQLMPLQISCSKPHLFNPLNLCICKDGTH